MSANTDRPSWKKRALLIVGGFVVFVFLFEVAIRITVSELFGGIASSRATALSASGWDVRSMWSNGWPGAMLQKGGGVEGNEAWIARMADIRSRSSSFEHAVDELHRIVAAHQGYFEQLRTETQPGAGRALAAALAVPSSEFDGTLADLKMVGRVESISQAGEDSAVQLATAARRLTAAQTNLARLQKLQSERKGELRDAVALEKDIAQANEFVAEAERQHENLLSTVAQAHIHVTLLEDYRAPLQVSMAGALLQIRNSLVEGIGTVFSTSAFFLSILLGYGVPVAFWVVLSFWPLRVLWRRFHPRTVAVAGS
jgi:hypothetical protein